jgi:hypothetical protein
VAEIYDAASRLAEGRPAAETVQDYVWACHLLGYKDPDLTLHASQVRDWYGSEDGMDLCALDADCEALRAAATAAEGVLARQEAQLVFMPVVWRGTGAAASREFLRRHGEASADVVNAVRAAAESLISLRDRLWHSIDGKVAATVAMENRGARPDWRAAVQTITTGAGDRVAASELVDQEVKPFVENDIRGEWLTAMRSTVATVTEAYDTAVVELTSQSAVAFEVPGDFGPAWSGPSGEAVGTTPAGVDSRGGGAIAGGPMGAPTGMATGWSASPPVAQSPLPAPPPQPPPPLAPPVEPAAMAPPSVPSLGGGMPDIGSGLSGFGGQLGDMLGGLLGASQEALSDLPENDEPDVPEDPEELDEDEPDESDDDVDEELLDDDETQEGSDTAEADPAAAAVDDEEVPAADPPPPVATEPPAEPPPPITVVPPPIEPLAAPDAPAGTPCEIAADELPQVGE